ncbi:MAG: hypothetical protein KAS23_17465, partial [Anaerohalosphaera sp.]|nr:hypothetical protein [Anaerohalosphaera sp.]
AGFEILISRIHEIIRQAGVGAYYVFDSLSEFARISFSERMMGNFFRLTCPLLYKLDTVAYYGVLRNHHSYHASLPIANTTQLLLDVYRHKGKIYIHPLKVDQRHSSTMFMLHEWKDDQFLPITESAAISEILTSATWPGLQSASYRMVGMWDRKFMHAEEILDSYERGECSKEVVDEIFKHQLRQLISHDDRILALAEKYFTLSDLIYFWKRLIGSGMIGGKAVGMLLARAILNKSDPRWSGVLEAHDSFFIGADIFYSFLVENNCWKIRQNQKDPNTLMMGVDQARQRILTGTFPDFIIARFSDMLDYFGQTQIIVRSSSLLEDNFGNVFSGKYESVFCTNNGSKQQRLEKFIEAVRFVYASTMSEKALRYRANRDVLDQDERMALLVQRVSGKAYGNIFFPQLAGVGHSYNPYVWEESIDPKAGMSRLVFGLGTRAVDRSDDDYTRVVALNAPEKRPESTFDKVVRYSQKLVDVLDMEKGCLCSKRFSEIANDYSDLPIRLFATYDSKLEQNGSSRSRHWVLVFDELLSNTSLVDDLREMLDTLRQAYDFHLEIEYTVNFFNDGSYKINLVQCRPLPIEESVSILGPNPDIEKHDIIINANSGIIGNSKTLTIDRLIYVVPEVYGQLSERDRYAVARQIGQLAHLDGNINIMLLGPGRWGTSTPSLGVPVSFAEINTVSVICEIDSMHQGLVPDLSLGTHFFNDLVEMNMLYIGFFGSREGNVLNSEFLQNAPNRLTDLVENVQPLDHIIRVIDSTDDQKMVLHTDAIKQNALVYLER